MRTRRFRPCVDFRPGLDLLPPRIAPSEVGPMLLQDPTPDAPAPVDPDTEPAPVIPPATIWTGPSEAPASAPNINTPIDTDC